MLKYLQELAKKTEGEESDEDEDEVEGEKDEQDYDEEEQEEVVKAWFSYILINRRCPCGFIVGDQ